MFSMNAKKRALGISIGSLLVLLASTAAATYRTDSPRVGRPAPSYSTQQMNHDDSDWCFPSYQTVTRCANSTNNSGVWTVPLNLNGSNVSVAAYATYANGQSYDGLNSVWLLTPAKAQLVAVNSDGSLNNYTTYVQSSGVAGAYTRMSLGSLTIPLDGTAFIQFLMAAQATNQGPPTAPGISTVEYQLETSRCACSRANIERPWR